MSDFYQSGFKLLEFSWRKTYLKMSNIYRTVFQQTWKCFFLSCNLYYYIHTSERSNRSFTTFGSQQSLRSVLYITSYYSMREGVGLMLKVGTKVVGTGINERKEQGITSGVLNGLVKVNDSFKGRGGWGRFDSRLSERRFLLCAIQRHWSISCLKKIL